MLCDHPGENYDSDHERGCNGDDTASCGASQQHEHGKQVEHDEQHSVNCLLRIHCHNGEQRNDKSGEAAHVVAVIKRTVRHSVSDIDGNACPAEVVAANEVHEPVVLEQVVVKELERRQHRVKSDADEQRYSDEFEVSGSAERVHCKQEHHEIARDGVESLGAVVLAVERNLAVKRIRCGGEGHDDVHNGTAHVYERALFNAPEQRQAAYQRHSYHYHRKHDCRKSLPLRVEVYKLVGGAGISAYNGAAVVHVGLL